MKPTEDPTKISLAVVHRPNDSGIDLPAGKAAPELDRTDYRAVEIDGEDEPAAPRGSPDHGAPRS